MRSPLVRFRADQSEHSVSIALLRAIRRARGWVMRTDCLRLVALQAFQVHLTQIGCEDPMFFLALRHYLADGLSTRQRVKAALIHYAHEESLGHAYFEQVYKRGELTLWQADVDGVAYDIKLMPGNDVLYEGGLSAVFHVNAERICVMSFSVVPRELVLPGSGPGEIVFATRKQLTQDHSYQPAFNAAFARTTPAHLCFGAMAGWAQALGFGQIVGIAAERHPSYDKAHASHFHSTYSKFWQTMSGRRVSTMGYLIDLPCELTPIKELEPRRRKRALARRRHMANVQESAMAATSAVATAGRDQG